MQNRQNTKVSGLVWLAALCMLTGYLQAADKAGAVSNTSVNSTGKVTPQKRIRAG